VSLSAFSVRGIPGLTIDGAAARALPLRAAWPDLRGAAARRPPPSGSRVAARPRGVARFRIRWAWDRCAPLSALAAARYSSLRYT